MNLLHMFCLIGLFVVSCVMAFTVILWAPINRWSMMAVRLCGCSAVLSITGLWVGLICKLINSTIN